MSWTRPLIIVTAAMLSAVPLLAQTPPEEAGAAPQPGAQNAPPAARQERPAPPERRARPELQFAGYRVDVTVYQVALEPGRALSLDRKSLAGKASTPAEFAAALAQLGTTRLLFRADQAVDLSRGAEIETSLDLPYVVGRSQSPSGATQNQVARQRNGVELKLSGQWQERDGLLVLSGVTANVDLSVLTDSNVSLASDMSAPCFMHVAQSHAGAARPGVPIVLVSVENLSGSGDRATAFVTRLVIEPE